MAERGRQQLECGSARVERRSRRSRRALHAARRTQRSAFTLLEVILAIGILAASLAIVGEVTRLSHLNAERAAMEGEALLIAESVIAQLVAGLIEPVEIAPTAWVVGNEPPEWRYALSVEPTGTAELLAARVTVEQITESSKPITASLVRWVVDPASIESATEEGV